MRGAIQVNTSEPLFESVVERGALRHNRYDNDNIVKLFTQHVAASTWTLEHKRGRRIVAKVFNESGSEINVEEDQSNLNVAVFRLNSIIPGFVMWI